MDVRCERCRTEYELENNSVSEAGTSVQCTACGHTFLVKRAPATTAPPPIPEAESAPAPADWLLETADGQSHRFRNLTSLQKWIIERKITRDDKISRTGQAWRRLGEIVELAPFFDVVDDADRARAVSAPRPPTAQASPPPGARSVSAQLKLEAERARSAGPRPSPSMPRPIARPEAGSLGASLRPSQSNPSLYARSLSDDGLDFSDRVAEIDTSVVRLSDGHTGRNVALGLVVVAGVLYLAVARHWIPTGVVSVSPAPSALPPAVPAAIPAAAPKVAAAPPPAAVVPAVAAEEVAPTAPVARTAAVKAGGYEDSYEKLVQAADRLLENGGNEKAQKLYERALRARPAGVEAISGLGYVMLDRGRVPLATAHFKRALVISAYGPAMFGLAEAYRALGDQAGALEAFRRYLVSNPAGADVSAARRQIAQLESQEAAGKGSEPSAVTPGAAPVSPGALEPPRGTAPK